MSSLATNSINKLHAGRIHATLMDWTGILLAPSDLRGS